jgi:hypothetical protein
LFVNRCVSGHQIPKPAVFLTTIPQQQVKVAEQFSNARDPGYAAPIEDVIRRLDPQIKRLEIRVAARRPELASHAQKTADSTAYLTPSKRTPRGIART